MKTKNAINKNKIYYLYENIFSMTKDRLNAANSGATIIIPHVCNNVDAYGAGFALEVANRFPAAKANFHLLGNQAKLGHVQFVNVQENTQYKHKLIIANMIAQNGLINKNNPRPLNYAALVNCMNQIRLYINRLYESNTDIEHIEIHAPKFGSGLAGGNWNFIHCLIEDIWNNSPVYIYQLRKK